MSSHLVFVIISVVWMFLSVYKQDQAMLATFVAFFFYTFNNWLKG